MLSNLMQQTCITPTVAYLRVSTARQGRSGLGLRRPTLGRRRLRGAAHGYAIKSEFVEVETGKGCDALDGGRSSPRRWPRPAK